MTEQEGNFVGILIVSAAVFAGLIAMAIVDVRGKAKIESLGLFPTKKTLFGCLTAVAVFGLIVVIGRLWLTLG